MKKIIDYLEIVGIIYDESIAYNIPNQDAPPYPFSLKEFREFTQNISNAANGEDEKYQVPGAYFETYVIPFFFEEKEYRLVIMYGQGSAWTLCTVKECEEWMERNRQLDLKMEDDDE